MNQADVTALTAAFNPNELVDTFVLLAPFIIGVAGLVIGISLVKWGIRTARKKLSGGVA
jgi:hypothetical protein